MGKDIFPDYIWNPKDGTLLSLKTGAKFLDPVTAETAVFNDKETVQNFLKEQNLNGIIGELISDELK